MSSYKTKSAVSRFKMNFASKCSESKWRIIIAMSIVLICFIAGIVVFASVPTCYPAGEYILSFTGVKSGFGAFFSRTLSFTVILGVTFACSLTVWTAPFSVILIGFRGYLLGFNIAALCSGFGMPGLLDAIFIVIPCQMCMLACLVLFFAFISKASSNCKKFGEQSSNKWKILLCFFVVLLLINLVETLLLSIFSAKVILVI